MIGNIELQSAGAVERWLRRAGLWQRVLTAATLIVALLLGAALLYFRPGSHPVVDPHTSIAAPVAKPALPPGLDTFYYWGQHQPLSQQP